MPILNLLVMFLSALVLIKSVDWFMDSTSKLAHHFKISTYTISFFLIAIATSLPETIVGITSALNKNSLLSFGNIVGANIALLTLVISIPVLINSSISTRAILRSKDMYVAFILALLPHALILDGVLSRTDGLILLVMYTFYAYFTFRESKGLELIIEKLEHINIWKQVSIFILSLLLLLLASDIIVKQALSLSSQLGLSITFIGLTLTAMGTTLPETVFAIGAVKGRYQQQVLGNILGSVVANSTMVLGIASILYPINISPITNGKLSAIIFFVITLIFFIAFAKSKENITRLEAFILLSIYFIFLFIEYQFSGLGR